ncbi:accessory Sec system protein Asp2, partial [Micrococcus luteus]
QLILSGLSMGSFGALYYATKLNPAAVIVGKPLINLGTIANNMKLVRPNDFGTSLDILRLNQNDITNKDVVQLDNHFW